MRKKRWLLAVFDFNGTLIRIVAIASSNRMAHPEVDFKNYNEVKKAFDLKD